MIEPTQEDIGRTVYYKKEGMKPSEYEQGVITGYSPTGHYVRVRYANKPHSESTRKEDLYWDATRLGSIHDALHQVALIPTQPPETKVAYCCDAMERMLKDPVYNIIDKKPGIMLALGGDAADEYLPLKFCPSCGVQLWQECPPCHGMGEIMYRAPDPDGASTPEIRGCSHCSISPGLIPLPQPIPRSSIDPQGEGIIRDCLKILEMNKVAPTLADLRMVLKDHFGCKGQ